MANNNIDIKKLANHWINEIKNQRKWIKDLL